MPENKVNIIKVIRSILRENVRRNAQSEDTLERSGKERGAAPLRTSLPSAVRLGELRDSGNAFVFLCSAIIDLWIKRDTVFGVRGSYGYGKPGKVLEFKNIKLQAWKSTGKKYKS